MQTKRVEGTKGGESDQNEVILFDDLGNSYQSILCYVVEGTGLSVNAIVRFG
jgi:hypothetical protein